MTKTAISPRTGAVLREAALSFFLLLITSCSIQDYYHGYVFDAETGKPLERVQVRESLTSGAKYSYTNKNGYFKVVNKQGTSSDLVFLAKGYKADTVLTRWSQHGELLEHTFTESKSDTVYLDASP